MRFPIKELPATPEEYDAWRYGVQSMSYTSMDAEEANNYWMMIDRYHDKGKPRRVGEQPAPTFDELKPDPELESKTVGRMDSRLFGTRLRR